MKKRFLKILSVALAMALMLITASSCESIIAPIEKDESSISTDENTDTTADVLHIPTDTEKGKETESEPESISETESESESETDTEEISDSTYENAGWVTSVEEIDIFGNYIPPETTTAAPTPDPSVPAYTPSYPSGSGIAPLALMYHLVLDEPYTDLTNLFVRPSELEGHIQALLEAGYTFIFADEYAYSNTKTVIMTFDDGYIDNYTEMFPIIKKYNVKVTVFMIASYIGGENFLTEGMIREMSSSGLVSFQSHTYTHPGLTSLSPDALRYEFETSCQTIEAITGREVRAICYPSGRYNNTVLSVAGEYFDYGYTTQSLTSTAGYPALTLPRLRVNRGYSKSYFASIIP